ncbi:MAG: M56 family metallopeptidase [Oscillospiraceae bacterium]
MIRETLTISALIAAVLLVRAVFKNRVPKRMIYALWLVVLLKLCMPGTLFSLPVLPAERTAAPVQRGVPGADRAGHPTARTGGTAANTRAASHAGTGKPGGEA